MKNQLAWTSPFGQAAAANLISSLYFFMGRYDRILSKYIRIRVTRGRYNPILSSLLRVVERLEVLPEFLKTSVD